MDDANLTQYDQLTLALNTSSDCVLQNAAQEEIHTLLHNTESRLDVVGSEISRLTILINDLTEEQFRLCQATDSYKQAIAPHRKLPNELSAEIFRHSVYEGITIPSTTSDGTAAAFILILVSKKWRQMALTTLAVWDNIRVKYNDWTKYDGITNAARNAIARCAPSPISLHISGHLATPTRPSCSTVDTKSDTLIIPNLECLKELSVASHPECMPPFFAIPFGSLKLLEVLEIAFDNDAPLVDGTLDTQVIFSAPSVTCVCDR
jgi:hypothetical protein